MAIVLLQRDSTKRGDLALEKDVFKQAFGVPPRFLGGTPLIVNDVLAGMPSSSRFSPRMVNSGKADWEERPVA